ERRFVEDLKAFHDANPTFFAEKELYLLRNMSRGRGVGFFEAGNFHPDFVVWQLMADRQQVAFVDPKGIRNVGLSDPKIGFHETVKEIELRLGNPDVVLESFIVSNTPSHVMRKQWGIEKAEMAKRHIVFQDEDKDTYIGAMLQNVVGVGT
ncbi:MAG: DEAD/DEAH box helicase family protein, partial [Candidatus Polarisedimenticolia bacterium]